MRHLRPPPSLALPRKGGGNTPCRADGPFPRLDVQISPERGPDELHFQTPYKGPDGFWSPGKCIRKMKRGSETASKPSSFRRSLRRTLISSVRSSVLDRLLTRSEATALANFICSTVQKAAHRPELFPSLLLQAHCPNFFEWHDRGFSMLQSGSLTRILAYVDCGREWRQIGGPERRL
jgi:hypothetical protein